MKLTELEPQFLKRVNDTHFVMVATLPEADGVMFLCPVCFIEEPRGRIGCHQVICWNPGVPQTTGPTPGRWPMTGSGYQDLTLAPSIKLEAPCAWHGFITNGEVTGA